MRCDLENLNILTDDGTRKEFGSRKQIQQQYPVELILSIGVVFNGIGYKTVARQL